ncbi:MAG: hypothetical protein ABIS29_06930 [Vicinamibacterales bacterium]
MPYGDAMLIDNCVRAMVMSLPKRYALGYPCCVFSKNNGDDFLAYLQGIEREAVRNLGRGGLYWKGSAQRATSAIRSRREVVAGRVPVMITAH